MVLPRIRRQHWIYKACEFPRLQKLVCILLIFFSGFTFSISYALVGFQVAFLISMGHLGYLIYPFTRFTKKTVAHADKTSKGNKLHLIVANVRQKNESHEKLLELLEHEKPDLILLVETNKRWQEALKPFTSSYPYKIEHPLDNTYGLLFYSKIRLEDAEVRHLVNEEYPSIKCRLQFENGANFWFVGVHPPPPSPTERTYSTPRDNELLVLAQEIASSQAPYLVAGDLNDVAWSYTTDLFLKRSGLQDPRKGRGIFSTYHAERWYMRWPLDHIFCSSKFKVIDLQRLMSIGSDYFPVSIKLLFT